MKLQVAKVHGHTIPKLQELVNDACKDLGLPLTLDTTLLGGWSSIALLLFSKDSKYVLKLPGLVETYPANPFEEEFRVGQYLAKERICPTPMKVGRLKDSNYTPFIVHGFVNGYTCASLEETSPNDFAMLGTTLTRLSQLKIPNIMAYPSPSEYMDYIMGRMEPFNEHTSEISKDLRKRIEVLQEYARDLGEYFDEAITWTRKPMHADLQESNIVYQSGKAWLLDIGSFCIGEPLYDVAYLFDQSPDMQVPQYPVELLVNSDMIKNVESLRPLALISVIEWSLEYLCNYELRRIEENLSSKSNAQAVRFYIDSKIEILRQVLEAKSLGF